MTNHWADIANSTLVLVWGANPAENHPACIGHINRARYPKQFYNAGSDTAPHRMDKTPAKLVVIDPRQTRTATMVDSANGDRYIRIRPGTDIALQNAVMRNVIADMESSTSWVSVAAKTAFFSFLNQTSNGTFYTDGNATAASTSGTTVPGCSKYTDARFLVNAAGTDYVRDRVLASTGAVTTVGPDNTTISGFPQKAATVDADPNTVYNRLKAHVAPYTGAVVADICGCTEDDIAFLSKILIENSRCSTVGTNDPRDPGYRATTILYAMGQTQHTYGAQNIKGFANVQSFMGNMGRAGGGINALRGIHNVQGSTDMGLLFGNIPAYSSNPTFASSFGDYMDGLWGNPLSGSNGTTGFGATPTPRTLMNGSYDDAYNTRAGALDAMALQQRGFFNMTLKWFGNYSQAIAATTQAARRPLVDAAYSLWPKGNGDDHVTMFRQMGSGATKALVCWGQNPAISEPNQGAVRTGLYNLDMLVCVDMFENETAGASRKPGSVTFLIPSAAHVEKAGSVTNSGRTLQWRYRAAAPSGNCKDDTELLLRFAKALDDNGLFSHIKTVWDANGVNYTTSVYNQLYGIPYDYAGGSGYETRSGTAEVVSVRKNVTDPMAVATTTVTGSEWVSELVYREMNLPSAGGGTIWIYTGSYNDDPNAPVGGVGYGPWTTANKAASQANWAVMNRAKSRDNTNYLYQLHSWGWGYSWLVNRRVFYNNSDVLGDVADFFMEPDSCSHIFATNNSALLNYSRWYRHNHTLKDLPSPVLAASTSSPHYAGNAVSLAGRFPGHTEPYETPRQDLLTAWGRNTKGTVGNAWDLVKNDTRVAGRGFKVADGKPVTDPPAASFPLVLTSIRCVEHFQGGVLTRNNWHNVELEPEPWLELNSADARKYSIKDGDYVRVVTARMVDDTGATVVPASYGAGFRARVGTGLSSSQKVGPGTVAIPWHWGEKGISTGSRANDLCIDACDANSTIPEYKACLCRLEKL
jgi:anaerobic selenocysteine-containing dehydrogenase